MDLQRKCWKKFFLKLPYQSNFDFSYFLHTDCHGWSFHDHGMILHGSDILTNHSRYFWDLKQHKRDGSETVLHLIITVIPNSFSLLMAFIQLSPTFSPFFLLLCFSEILLVCNFVMFLKMGPLTAEEWGKHWKFFLQKSQIRCFKIKNHFIPELTNSDEMCIQDSWK